jgi:hypothetical protein
MNSPRESEEDRLAYLRVKKAVDENYPRGWFAAISGDQILAASADFHELESMLRAQGKDPREVLVVESGVDYPEYVTIFA